MMKREHRKCRRNDDDVVARIDAGTDRQEDRHPRANRASDFLGGVAHPVQLMNLCGDRFPELSVPRRRRVEGVPFPHSFIPRPADELWSGGIGLPVEETISTRNLLGGHRDLDQRRSVGS